MILVGLVVFVNNMFLSHLDRKKVFFIISTPSNSSDNCFMNCLQTVIFVFSQICYFLPLNDSMNRI